MYRSYNPGVTKTPTKPGKSAINVGLVRNRSQPKARRGARALACMLGEKEPCFTCLPGEENEPPLRPYGVAGTFADWPCQSVLRSAGETNIRHAPGEFPTSPPHNPEVIADSLKRPTDRQAREPPRESERRSGTPARRGERSFACTPGEENRASLACRERRTSLRLHARREERAPLPPTLRVAGTFADWPCQSVRRTAQPFCHVTERSRPSPRSFASLTGGTDLRDRTPHSPRLIGGTSDLRDRNPPRAGSPRQPSRNP